MDDELNYDIVNYMAYSWFDTDTYDLCRDDNKGYVFGIVSWYGQYDLDTVTDWYNSDGTDISWEWFKTEKDRDNNLKEDV